MAANVCQPVDANRSMAIVRAARFIITLLSDAGGTAAHALSRQLSITNDVTRRRHVTHRGKGRGSGSGRGTGVAGVTLVVGEPSRKERRLAEVPVHTAVVRGFGGRGGGGCPLRETASAGRRSVDDLPLIFQVARASPSSPSSETGGVVEGPSVEGRLERLTDADDTRSDAAATGVTVETYPAPVDRRWTLLLLLFVFLVSIRFLKDRVKVGPGHHHSLPGASDGLPHKTRHISSGLR